MAFCRAPTPPAPCFRGCLGDACFPGSPDSGGSGADFHIKVFWFDMSGPPLRTEAKGVPLFPLAQNSLQAERGYMVGIPQKHGKANEHAVATQDKKISVGADDRHAESLAGKDGA